MIIDEHLKIEDGIDLMNYIYERLTKENCFDYVRVGVNLITGLINGVEFQIDFKSGKSCTLMVEDGYPEEFNLLAKVIKPVMWKVNPSIEKENVFASPIITYVTESDMRVLEWDNEKPMLKLRCIAFDYYKGNCKLKEVKVLYPGVEFEDLKADLRYGAYTGFFDSDMIEEIENLTELELFDLISALRFKYKNIKNAGIILEEDVSDRLDTIDYQVAYYIQQLKKFGVKINPPSEKCEEQSVEFEAWYRWWADAYDDIIKEHPELSEQLEKGHVETIVKPRGSYKKYIPQIAEERERREAELDEAKVENE